MKSFVGFLIMCFLLACAILDFLKLVERNAPQPAYSKARQPNTRRIITGTTRPAKVNEHTAACIREAVSQMEAAQPPRQFREFEPQEDMLIILPGAPGGFDAAEGLSRRADEKAAEKWAHNTGKAPYTQALDREEKAETAAEKAARYKRESDERIYGKYQSRMAARKPAAGE